MEIYSQFGGYEFLKEYFLKHLSKHKYIVDVGAYGKHGSNSFNLIATESWRGLLIEPNNENFKQLVKDFEGLDVMCLNYAISNYNGKGVLNFSETMLGHSSLILNKNAHNDVQKCNVRTLVSILMETNTPLDFDILDVDTEGTDYTILEYMLKNSNFRPTLIIVEDSKEVCKKLFSKYKYRRLKQLGVNRIYEVVK